MTSSAAPVADETPLGATFWDLLPTGHRVALFAAPIMLLGALGPWFSGQLVEARIASPGLHDGMVYGYAWEGWLVAAPTILAMLALVLVKDRQKRSGRALTLFTIATMFAIAEWIVIGFGIAVDLALNASSTLFGNGPWTNVDILWSLPLAVAAGLVAMGGALAGSRDPNQKPTY